MRRNSAITLALLGLALNLIRYNLSGAFDTFELFVFFDAVAWSLTALTFLCLTRNIILRNIFLFTFVLTLNAIYNAYNLIADKKADQSELVFLVAAILAVTLNTLAPKINFILCRWKRHRAQANRTKAEAKRQTGRRGG